MNGLSITGMPPLTECQGINMDHILGLAPVFNSDGQQVTQLNHATLSNAPTMPEWFADGRSSGGGYEGSWGVDECAYKGLWDVFGTGTAKSLASRLEDCARLNAHPDWQLYLDKLAKAVPDLTERLTILSDGLRLAKWHQGVADVYREAECRRLGLFVVQKINWPITWDQGSFERGEIRVG